MVFKFTEEQELLAASLIEFMDREFPESLMKECDENHRFPEEANRKFFEAGFGTIGIPEEYGILDWLAVRADFVNQQKSYSMQRTYDQGFRDRRTHNHKKGACIQHPHPSCIVFLILLI